jgi:hypothetical protein
MSSENLDLGVENEGIRRKRTGRNVLVYEKAINRELRGSFIMLKKNLATLIGKVLLKPLPLSLTW